MLRFVHPGLIVTGMLAALGAGAASGLATANNEPHPHDGILAPYDAAPPEVELSAVDIGMLARGKTLIRTVRVHDDDRALAVVRVDAPPSVVWSVLLDFDAYPQWVDGLQAVEIYERNGSDIYVKFNHRSWPVGEIKYYVRHTFPGEALGWGTWTLDYRRRSDLDDSVGFWRVMDVAGNPRRSYVVYATCVRLDGRLAQWLGDWLLEKTLRVVTGGLKSRAESIQAHPAH